MLMLALSSLSRNSRYVALFWMGIWFVTQHRCRMVLMNSRATSNDRHAAPECSIAHVGCKRGISGLQKSKRRKTDWRPLISYTANLSRVGEQLLGTNAAWERLSQLSPPRPAQPDSCCR